LKPLNDVLLERRAASHFLPDEVPEEYLNAILRLGAQAPSGYNLQPWRFIVVRDAENRKRLQKAAYNQPKVAEAPVVIIALGMKEEWKRRAPEVFEEGARRGAGNPANVEAYMQGAFDFLSHQPMNVWVNRHVMIAVTTMMLLAGVPEEAEVVALLAIGRVRPPDKAYAGRFSLDQIVFAERYGEAWKEP
jgi:nitroreductase